MRGHHSCTEYAQQLICSGHWDSQRNWSQFYALAALQLCPLLWVTVVTGGNYWLGSPTCHRAPFAMPPCSFVVHVLQTLCKNLLYSTLLHRCSFNAIASWLCMQTITENYKKQTPMHFERFSFLVTYLFHWFDDLTHKAFAICVHGVSLCNFATVNEVSDYCNGTCRSDCLYLFVVSFVILAIDHCMGLSLFDVLLCFALTYCLCIQPQP